MFVSSRSDGPAAPYSRLADPPRFHRNRALPAEDETLSFPLWIAVEPGFKGPQTSL